MQNARCVQDAVFAQNVMFLQPQQLLPFCFSAGSSRSGSSWDHHRYQHHQSDRPLITAILVALGFFGGASGLVLADLCLPLKCILFQVVVGLW